MSDLELFMIKFVSTVSIVLILSFVAENISPEWAGILSGFPTGSAITLHFYALENGLEFAGESAVYNMIGLVAMQMFIFCYYICSLHVKKYEIALSVFGSVLGYLATIILLSNLHITLGGAIIIPVISFLIFKYLFRKIDYSIIIEQVTPTWGIVLFRSSIAAIIICIITWLANMIGSTWAGLLSAFPTTLFPLLLIIHLSYGRQYAHSIIKHVPEGLGGLLTYSLIIYLCYPAISLYSGIVLAFSGAIVYLFLYNFITRWLCKQTPLQFKQ